MGNLTIDNIEVEVQKKNIKNLYLSVLPPNGRVRVSAPVNMDDEAVKVFIAAKISWIRKHQDKYKNRPVQCENKYVSGETILLWGKPYYLEVVYSNARNNIKIDGSRLILQVRGISTVEQRADVVNKWYRANIKREIPKLLEKWQKTMGVAVLEWRVKNMKTRWGTCNIKDKRIWLNLQLAKKHPVCLEYVVVHELVHLLERNHNKIFKSYMDKFLPNWRVIKKELNF